MAATTAAPYPVTLSVSDDQSVENWRPLAHWAMAIPHLIIANILSIVGWALAVVSWFIIVITGRLPQGIADFQVMLLRYSYRAYGFFWGLSVDYPPFSFDERGDADDITVSVQPDLEGRSRLSVAFRIFLVIPLELVAIVYVLGALCIGVVAWFVVLFTGTYPLGLRMMMTGLFQWSLRLNAFAGLLVDRYPPFGATVNTL